MEIVYIGETSGAEVGLKTGRKNFCGERAGK